MALIYKTICLECDKQCQLRAIECEHCGSTDLYTECVAAVVDDADYARMDREAEQRRALKRYWDELYAGMDLFAVARDLTATACDTGEVPAIAFAKRQAS